MIAERATVLIFRDLLLPFSEVFIRKQAEGLVRYRPIFVGSRMLPGGVPVEPVEILSGGALVQARFRLLRRPPAEWVERLHALRPRLIHAHFGFDGFLAAPLARALGIPLVVTFHGYDATIVHPRTLKEIAWIRLRPAVFRAATRILTCSEFVRGRLIALGCDAAKITVHYIGVEQARAISAAPPEPPTVLFVGRLVEQKGCEDLIVAAALAANRIPGLRLRMIGDGPLRPLLEARGKALGIPIEFPGALPHEKALAEMSEASLLALPSRIARNGWQEGLGLVSLEATAAGIPVVATSTGGIPEVVEHDRTGLLVPQRSPARLAEAILALLTDRDLASRLVQEGRRRVQSRFSLREQCRLLEEIYDQVAHPGSPGE